MTKQLIKCGDANPDGNVEMFYKGSCKKTLNKLDGYRCTGCGAWFHFGCIHKHFYEEEKHDVARNAIKKVLEYTKDEHIKWLCKQGLERNEKLNTKNAKAQ